MLEVGSDYSGAGAFDQALMRLKIDYDTIFACDIDMNARKTYLSNYGTMEDLEKCDVRFEKYEDCPFSFYFPLNVYDRKIPEKPLDIYMTSPPCQSFSLAGKRLGKNDPKGRGLLFFNSLEFIRENKPRHFIFENVKGLLTNDNGHTFQEWLYYLGGRSVNGIPILMKNEDSVPYHLYWKVLNSKDYNVPQSRERVFLVGIRDDIDNIYPFSPTEKLTRHIKDLIDEKVDERYYLKDNMIRGFPDIVPEVPISDEIIIVNDTSDIYKITNQICHENGIMPTLTTDRRNIIYHIGAYRGRNVENPLSRKSGEPTKQMLEINKNNLCNTLTTVRKDNVLVEDDSDRRKVRYLTPRECFRFMDFPESFDCHSVTETQACKQAGNSIPVALLVSILKNLKL